MSRVWLMPPAAVMSTERLVLLNLASHRRDDGRNAFPGVQRIPALTSLTPRAILKALRRLAEKGFIDAVGQSSRRTTHYALALDRLPIHPEPRSQSKANHVRSHSEPPSQSAPVEGERGSSVSEPCSSGGRTTFAGRVNVVHPIRKGNVIDTSSEPSHACQASRESPTPLLGDLGDIVKREGVNGTDLEASFAAFRAASRKRPARPPPGSGGGKGGPTPRCWRRWSRRWTGSAGRINRSERAPDSFRIPRHGWTRSAGRTSRTTPRT